jgi:hypothetical protein
MRFVFSVISILSLGVSIMRTFSFLAHAIIIIGFLLLLDVSSSSSWKGKEREKQDDAVDDLRSPTHAIPMLRHVLSSSSSLSSSFSTASTPLLLSSPVLINFINDGATRVKGFITECTDAVDAHVYTRENLSAVNPSSSAEIEEDLSSDHDELSPCDEFKVAIANALMTSASDEDEGFDILIALQYWTHVGDLMELYPEQNFQNEYFRAISSSSTSSCSRSGPLSSILASATSATVAGSHSLFITPDEIRNFLITDLLSERNFYHSLLSPTKEK